MDEYIEEQKPKLALRKMNTLKERNVQKAEELSDKDMAVAMRFTRPFLEEIYDDAVKKAKFRRTLEEIRRVLREVLKTREVPGDLNQLTATV